jgi:hypothetical protein
MYDIIAAGGKKSTLNMATDDRVLIARFHLRARVLGGLVGQTARVAGDRLVPGRRGRNAR